MADSKVMVFVTQTCQNCLELINLLDQENLLVPMKENGITINFYNENIQNGKIIMEQVVKWAQDIDPEKFEDAKYIAPVIVSVTEDTVEVLNAGTKGVVDTVKILLSLLES